MSFQYRAPIFILCLTALTNIHAQIAWPKEIPFKNGGKATIYQPQPESFEGNKLIGWRNAKRIIVYNPSENV